MKKISIVCLAVVMAVVFGFGNAFAASAKATALCRDISVIKAKSSSEVSSLDASGNPFEGFAPIFTGQVIKTAEQKELFVDVSLECGLTTNTKVMSKNLAKATAEAVAVVEVVVTVDNEGDCLAWTPAIKNENEDEILPAAVTFAADPGVVTFARRSQGLIAEFAGSYALNCDDEGVCTLDVTDQETLQLVLKTMSANSFNFIAADLSAGEHTVQVWARLSYQSVNGDDINTDIDADGEAVATAFLGKGFVTIEEVRMVNE